ncbi:phosphoesterase [Chitinispirillum alkaliphilum]|nr:phosphoesterase [Chitinispirillum alkaliphilum]
MNTIDDAVAFIRSISSDARVCVLYHGDADGACGAAIIYRLLRQNVREIYTLALGRGENPFSAATIQKIEKLNPVKLIVIDSGSRAGSFGSAIQSLIIDHHIPDSTPDVDVFYNPILFGEEITATEATFNIASRITSDRTLVWLAIAGIIGDSGVKGVPVRFREEMLRAGQKNFQEAVALINAARRHATFQIDTAFRLLIDAQEPSDFVNNATRAGLANLRNEVSENLRKNLRRAPRFHGNIALIEIDSPHQIHPLVSTIWAGKLKTSVVMVANRGYLPGRVSFSMRTKTGINLLKLLKQYRSGSQEMGFGHEKASGGILATDEFDHLLILMGF